MSWLQNTRSHSHVTNTTPMSQTGDNISRPSSRTSFLGREIDGTVEESTILPRGAVVGEGEEGDGQQKEGLVKYRVYWWRWFMLAVIFLLNISNGMVS